MGTVKALEKPGAVEWAVSALDMRHSKYGVMVRIGLETGLRISDILRFRVCDVRDGEIFIREAKTGKKRLISLSDDTREHIAAHVAANKLRPTDYLVYSRECKQDKPLSRNRAWRVMRDTGLAFGEEQIGTHSMRKTYARGVLNETGDVLEVQKSLGHSHLMTSLGYLTDPGQLASAIEAALFGKKS